MRSGRPRLRVARLPSRPCRIATRDAVAYSRSSCVRSGWRRFASSVPRTPSRRSRRRRIRSIAHNRPVQGAAPLRQSQEEAKAAAPGTGFMASASVRSIFGLTDTLSHVRTESPIRAASRAIGRTREATVFVLRQQSASGFKTRRSRTGWLPLAPPRWHGRRLEGDTEAEALRRVVDMVLAETRKGTGETSGGSDG